MSCSFKCPHCKRPIQPSRVRLVKQTKQKVILAYTCTKCEKRGEETIEVSQARECDNINLVL